MRKTQIKRMEASKTERRAQASAEVVAEKALSKEESTAARSFSEKLSELGWNQTEAAEKLMISRTHVNNICRERSSPSPHLLRLLELELADFNRNSPAAEKVAQEFENIRKALSRFPPNKRMVVARRILSLLKAF